MISLEDVKQLREETGVSISECKKALEQCQGNMGSAKETLRKWGKGFAGDKVKNETTQGIIDSYIHPNKRIGVMIEIRCESDFVSRSEEFQKLSHEICLQIAAMKPLYAKAEDIPEEFLAGEKRIYKEQLAGSGKPEKLINEILEGKLNKYKEEVSLYSQTWIKDDTKTLGDLINEHIARFGENIVVKKFSRYEL